MQVKKLKTLEIKTRDGETMHFREEPILNYDVQAGCFVIGSFKDQLEAYFFPVMNIVYIKESFELMEGKPILIPTTKFSLPSTESKQ